MTDTTDQHAPDLPVSGGLHEQVTTEAARLGAELVEIDMLVAQARVEAGRHEQKREQAAQKLAAAQASGADATQALQLCSQLVGLTRRAALMDAQVEVLEGKRRTLARFRDSLEQVAQALGEGPPIPARPGNGAGLAGGAASSTLSPSPGSPGQSDRRQEAAQRTPAVSRAILSAQEELRREIARAMHDGPAQSLTNIVLQAQIVERLVTRDPAMARGELRQLMTMVQQTLDATKTFIFDVRPMVLDDLGLLPTLRRTARDRSRRSRIPVHFESLGTDRRLASELESGLFRILDDALAAYLAVSPTHVELRLDWAEQLEVRLAAGPRAGSKAAAAAAAAAAAGAEAGAGGIGREPAAGGIGREPAAGEARHGKPSGSDQERSDLPPALAAMIEDRAEDERRAVEAARTASISALPVAAWDEIRGRASALGVTAEFLSEGAELRLVVDLAAGGERSA